MTTAARIPTQLQGTTGVWQLDVLAASEQLAFRDAEHPDPLRHIPARSHLIEFWGTGTIKYLYRHGLISWHPDHVKCQFSFLEV